MTSRLSRVPLRTQLLAVVVGAVALVVVVTALVGTAALRGYLVDRVDAQLVSALGRERGPDREPGRPGRRGPREDLAVTVLAFDAAGTELTRQPLRSTGTGPRIDDVLVLPRGLSEVDGVDGGRWRVLAAPGPGGSTVVAGASLAGVRETTARLLAIDAAVGLLALACVGLLARAAVRRSLAPLSAVEATAQAVAAGDLAVRVPAGAPRTEIGSLATSFNTMVDRFQTAYAAQQRSESDARASEERMRRFVGDAGHELRTPLTSIRGFAELFRQGAADDPEQLARVLRRIEDEAARMGVLVDDLLLLARLDQARPLRRDPVDLLAVLADVVQDAEALHGADHAVSVELVTGPYAPTVLGDDARLRQVFGNLVGNAVVHTPAGTAVRVLVRGTPGEVVVEVRDAGPGMSAEVVEQAFDRFYRADAARSRTPSSRTAASRASGSGLGLSIVAGLVAAHGGTVTATSSPAGSTFTVVLPRA